MPARVVKMELKRRGLTIASVARRINRSRPLVSLVIRKRTASAYVWHEIAKVLDGARRRQRGQRSAKKTITRKRTRPCGAVTASLRPLAHP